jgi:uncharacterized RDD family membrane protein YckC
VAELEIRTPEGIALRTELAGAGARFAAALIDGVIFAFAYLGLTLIAALLAALGGGGVAEFVNGLLLVGVIPIFVLAGVLQHGLGRGRTLGKRVLGLRVTTAEGYPPGWTAWILRGLLLPVDALIPLPLPGVLGLATIALTERRQRLGDLVAGTVVISEARLPQAAEPFPKENWTALPTKKLALSPGLAARLDADDLALLRDLLARAPLEPEYKRDLFVRTARHFAERLELGEFEDARVFLKELYLYLREQRRAA